MSSKHYHVLFLFLLYTVSGGERAAEEKAAEAEAGECKPPVSAQ